VSQPIRQRTIRNCVVLTTVKIYCYTYTITTWQITARLFFWSNKIL